MLINSITELEQGAIVDAKVIKIDKSIVELELLNGRKGKMHISEVANQHIESIGDILKHGDIFRALVIDFEKGGCPKLSRRRVDQETGEFFEGELYNEDKRMVQMREAIIILHLTKNLDTVNGLSALVLDLVIEITGRNSVMMTLHLASIKNVILSIILLIISLLLDKGFRNYATITGF